MSVLDIISWAPEGLWKGLCGVQICKRFPSTDSSLSLRPSVHWELIFVQGFSLTHLHAGIWFSRHRLLKGQFFSNVLHVCKPVHVCAWCMCMCVWICERVYECACVTKIVHVCMCMYVLYICVCVYVDVVCVCYPHVLCYWSPYLSSIARISSNFYKGSKQSFSTANLIRKYLPGVLCTQSKLQFISNGTYNPVRPWVF